MKKKVSIFIPVALLAAAVAVFVCTDVKYDNPLDESGTNFLYGRKYDSAKVKSALDTNADGTARLFTNPEEFSCDPTAPALELVGERSPTILSNELTKFRRFMNLDNIGWAELIKGYEKYTDATVLPARLTRGGNEDVPFSPNAVPEANDVPYVIVYAAERPLCPGDAKKPTGMVTRTLKIEKYVEIDSTTPKIGLIGGTPVSVVEGETYKDQGVTITFKSGDIAPEALDSIVITGTGNYRVKVNKPINGNYDGVVVPSVSPGAKYTIVYYATAPNGVSAAPASRVVNVTEKSNVGTPKAVIELNPYKHTISGKTIYHNDTAIVIGGAYVEKGVKRAYYLKDGKDTTAVNVDLVVKPTAPSTNGNAYMQRSLSYKLPSGSGWTGADDAVRNVYLVDALCDGKAPPEITEKGSGTIPAGQEWKHGESWSVANKDKDDDVVVGGSIGKQYLIDFGGLDPKNPKRGDYTVTYVGLGGCGSTAYKERKIKVE